MEKKTDNEKQETFTMKPSIYTMHRLATDESARRAVIDAVSTPPNGEIHDVEKRIAAYEAKFGMSSDDALTALEQGELRPTCEVEGWMMALRLRDYLANPIVGRVVAREDAGRTIKPGDVVRLKSGGPRMTVERVYAADNYGEDSGDWEPVLTVVTRSGEPRVENPEHDSLVVKFDQLDLMIERARANVAEPSAHFKRLVQVYLSEAIRLATIIREQVLR